MTGYIVRRLIGVVINLVLVSAMIFFILGVLPGDIASIHLGQDARPEQVEQWREQHGLNHSLPHRYLVWAEGAIHGDFGKSLTSNLQVTSEFGHRLKITMEILIFSFIATTAVGILGGIISATQQDTISDYVLRIFAIFGLSIPSFLLLTLLLIIPAHFWHYAPPFGAVDFFKRPLDNLELFIPATVFLAISSSAGLMRLTRTAFLDVLRQDYMRTARSKGLSERAVTYRHGFRNAMPPILTLLSLQLRNLLGGSIILEAVLGLPGVGAWTLTAIGFNDYPIVMAVAMYTAFAVMAINLITDLAYAWLDPRIKYA